MPPRSLQENQRGNDTCKICPEGFYCEVNTTIPVDCPEGYYCPGGTRNGTQFACPRGTFSNITTLVSMDECEPCTPGMYCGEEALRAPSDNCTAGYYCGLGASVATSHDSDSYHVSYVGETCVSVNATAVNDICPPGHYCPSGSSSPIQCPPGTNSSSAGLTSASECPACVKGYYCPLNGTVWATRQCLAGYYCPSGTANPSDDESLVCPAGSYCPVGSDYAIPCPAGTYQDELGNSTCKACLAGHYCEVNTTITVKCPVGHYCPVGTSRSNQFACLSGTFQNQTGQSSCDNCLAGGYCPFLAMTSNVLCPPGYYCPSGLADFSSHPCPAGTFSNISGLRSSKQCTECLPGYFCASTGLREPEGLCSPGHYCSSGAKTSTPTDGITGGLCGGGHVCAGGASHSYPINGIGGYVCPSGTQCPPGSSVPEGCPPGTFTPTDGATYCPDCPAGSLCPGNMTYLLPCPLRHYCPKRSGSPLLCPNGTFGAALNLAAKNQCASCPPGYYCVDGTITGECAPSHFSRSGQGTPTPFHDVSRFSNDPARILEYLDTLNGGQCPPGHYCYSGTSEPFPCENTTVRLDMFGGSPNDCGPCPAGYICFNGDPVPFPCNAGYYCPVGESSIPCPPGRYNSLQSKDTYDDCLMCPAGSFCNSSAISDPNQWPCPAGHFCLEGTTEPLPCPSGTYRDTVGAAKEGDCHQCPGGHYCPRETTVLYSCGNGVYCPPGSVNTTICPAGYYCPANSSYPLPCPENYYCPQKTFTPLPCYRGTYCPAGTSYPILCDAGFKAVDESNFTLQLLYSNSSACQSCLPGEYGDDPARLSCKPCPAGYVCLGATTKANPTDVPVDKGYICPKGSFCPSGSSAEMKCPPGTYQPHTGESNSTACLKCKPGFYQNIAGQDSCFRCSSNSRSVLVGATECTCIGQNRVFQLDDGWCVCQPGYEFVDANLVVSSESDGPYDCQPIVFPRCAENEVRNSNGECVIGNAYCSSICGNGGTFILATGTCECNGAPTLNEICNEDCRDSALRVVCNDESTVMVIDPKTGTEDNLDLSSLNLQGEIDCSNSNSNSNIYSMRTTDGTFSAIFGLGSTLSTLFESRRFNSYPQFSRRLSLLNATNSSGILENPLVCLKLQDSLLFDISNTHYPEYVKDSLLNTNDGFDYSTFRSLVRNAASTFTLTSLAVTFGEAGTYVFGMSSQPTRLLIVAVMPANVNCSTVSHFVEFTASNLITMGVTSSNDIVLSPDWNLVIGLLLGMLGLVLILLGFMYYFRKRAWISHYKIQNRSREQNKSENNLKTSQGGYLTKLSRPHAIHPDGLNPIDLRKFESVGEFDLEAAAAMKEAADIAFNDEILVPELAKRLQSHHDELDRQMHIQNDLLHEIRGSLKKEVDELKNLLTSNILNGTFGAGMPLDQSKLCNLLTYMKKDLLARESYEATLHATHQRLDHSLSSIHCHFTTPGCEELANEILSELIDSTQQAVIQHLPPQPLPPLPSHSNEYHLHSVVDSVLHSILLKNCIEELESMKGYVESSLLLSLHDEERRSQSSRIIIEKSIQSTALSLPSSITFGYQQCSRLANETDLAGDQLVVIYKAFIQRIPKFVHALVLAESNLRRDLYHSFEAGNMESVESTKSSGLELIASYFHELYDAISVMRSTITDKSASYNHISADGSSSRQTLIQEIDSFLSSFESSVVTSHLLDGSKQLPQHQDSASGGGKSVKSALKRSTSSTFRRTFSDVKQQLEEETSSDEGGNDDPDSLNSTSKVGIQDIMLKTLEYRPNLTPEQKNELLNEVESDMKRLATILELEEKRSLEAIQSLQVNPFTQPALTGQTSGPLSVSCGGHGHAESFNELETKHERERQQLLAQLDEERVSKLNMLMRQESRIDVADDLDTIHESRILCVLSSRYACLMRYYSLKARYEYLAMHETFVEKRLLLKKEFYKHNAAKDSNRSRHQLMIPPELARNLQELCDQEEVELQALAARMIKQRSTIEQQESNLRESWNARILEINIEQELKKLHSEMTALFEELLATSLQQFQEKLQSNSSLEGEIHHHLFQYRCGNTETSHSKSGEGSEVLKAQLSAKLEQWNSLKSAELTDRIAFELSFINTVRFQINDILSYGDSYGPSIDQQSLSSGLYQRILTAIDVFHQNKIRNHSIEQFLKLESNEMKLFCQLNRHQGFHEITEEEIMTVINDHRLVEKKKSEQLMGKLVQEHENQQKLVQEKQRAVNNVSTRDFASFEIELLAWCNDIMLQSLQAMIDLERSQGSLFQLIFQSLSYKREHLIQQFQPKSTTKSSKTQESSHEAFNSDMGAQQSQSYKSLQPILPSNNQSYESSLLLHFKCHQIYPEYVTKEIQHQIDSEIQREECELLSVYTSLMMNTNLAERLSYTMIYGVHVCSNSHQSSGSIVQFFSNIPTLTLTTQHLFSLASLGYDRDRKLEHHTLLNYLSKEYEELRHLYLGGRSATRTEVIGDSDELQAVYDEIDQKMDTDLENYALAFPAELQQLQDHVHHFLVDYRQIGEECSAELSLFHQEYQTIRQSLESDMAQEQRTLKERHLKRIGDAFGEEVGKYSLERLNDETKLVSNVDYLRENLQLSQSYLAKLSTQNIAFAQQITTLYTRYWTKYRQLTRVEDDLNLMRNNKQQEIEGRTIAAEMKTKDQFYDLVISQMKRRDELEKIKLLKERDLIGLEEQMKQKKTVMMSRLQRILKLKKLDREKLLGRSLKSAPSVQLQRIIQHEFEFYETNKLREVEEFLQLEEKRYRDEIDKEIKGESNRISVLYQFLQGDVVHGAGFDDLKENELKSLKGMLEMEKKQLRDSLLASGLSSEEVERKLNDEFALKEANLQVVAQKLAQQTQDHILKYMDRERKDEIARKETLLSQKKAEMKKKLTLKREKLLHEKLDEMKEKKVGRERQLPEDHPPRIRRNK